MSNPSFALQSVEESLQSIIKTLIDCQKGYLKIGEELSNPTLKHYFLEESLTCAELRGDLESALHHEGVHDIDEHGTVNATLNRAWADLKATLGGGDQSRLETAQQDGDAAIKQYAEALNKELPFPVREILAAQAAHIQLFNAYIKLVLESCQG
jgi:uncharacterized protein (TIGR02284 family)